MVCLRLPLIERSRTRSPRPVTGIGPELRTISTDFATASRFPNRGDWSRTVETASSLRNASSDHALGRPTGRGIGGGACCPVDPLTDTALLPKNRRLRRPSPMESTESGLRSRARYRKLSGLLGMSAETSTAGPLSHMHPSGSSCSRCCHKPTRTEPSAGSANSRRRSCATAGRLCGRLNPCNESPTPPIVTGLRPPRDSVPPVAGGIAPWPPRSSR